MVSAGKHAGRLSALTLAALALPELATFAAPPAQAVVKSCSYRIQVIAGAARGVNAPGWFVPGATLRSRGQQITSGLRGPFANDTQLARQHAAHAAQLCLRDAVNTTGIPGRCRRRMTMGTHARNYGRVTQWNVRNVVHTSMNYLCTIQRRAGVARPANVAIAAYRVSGGGECNLGIFTGRRPRRFIVYRAPYWQCASARPVPRDPVPPAVRNCRNNHAPVCVHLGGNRYSTFRNACHARRAGRRIVYEGRCQANRARQNQPGRPARQAQCPRNYNPVCAMTRRGLRTFVNACRAREYRGRVVYRGTCRRR